MKHIKNMQSKINLTKGRDNNSNGDFIAEETEVEGAHVHLEVQEEDVGDHMGEGKLHF